MESSAIERSIRTELARIDPDLALFDIKTMNERMDLSLSSRRALMSLALGFGATALFLSVIGIYGVLAHLVTSAAAKSAFESLSAAPAVASSAWFSAKASSWSLAESSSESPAPPRCAR